MENKQFYINQLKRTLIYAGISSIIFISIFVGLLGGEGAAWSIGIVAGLIYGAGLPSGWSITGKVFSGWVITGIFGIIILVLRFMFSSVIGIVALPITIVRTIQMIHNAPDDNQNNHYGY